MSNTSEIKKDIRKVVKKLESEYNVIFNEKNIVPDGRKYHGYAVDKSICLFVCNNQLQDGKIIAGQRQSIFEKCYWLSLSDCSQKLVVFTNKDFYNKFLEEYSDYFINVKPKLFIG